MNQEELRAIISVNGSPTRETLNFRSSNEAVSRLREHSKSVILLEVVMRTDPTPTAIDALRKLLGLPFPQLQTLKLHGPRTPPDIWSEYYRPCTVSDYPPSSFDTYDAFNNARFPTAAPSSPQNALTYESFMRALVSLPALQELVLTNFLQIPSYTLGLPPSVAKPRELPNLRRLVVRDMPRRTRTFLSLLHIPETVREVNIASGPCGGPWEIADVLHGMLPCERTKHLPLLGTAAHLRVGVSKDGVRLRGFRARGGGAEPSVIELDLVPLLSALGTREARGAGLRVVLEQVCAVFDTRRVSNLTVAGEIGWLRAPQEWANFFSAFPLIQTLRVEVEASSPSNEPHGPLVGLLNGLGARGNFKTGEEDKLKVPVCACLKDFSVIVPSTFMPLTRWMGEALSERKNRGGQKLRTLNLEVTDYGGTQKKDVQQAVNNMLVVARCVNVRVNEGGGTKASFVAAEA